MFYTNGSLSVTTVNGYAMFTGMYFLRPPSGDYVLSFRDTSTGWVYNHSFTMTVGEAHKIRMCTEPPEYLDNLQPTLQINPRVFLEDVSGNQLTAASFSGLRVEASYFVEWTSTTALDESNQRLGVPVNVQYSSKIDSRVAQISGNFLEFEGIEMHGLYGRTYSINITSPKLQNVTTRSLKVKYCNNKHRDGHEGPGCTHVLCEANDQRVLRLSRWRVLRRNTQRSAGCG